MTRSAFPLRFDENSVVKQALEEVSAQTGISMNRLIQDAVAVQLNFSTRVLEGRLESVIEDLRGYRGQWTDREIASFARAEVENQDPVEGRMVEPPQADPFSLVAPSADALE